MSVGWVFDPAPPSGKRTGGNAAEYSFQEKIDTLVREVVQNAMDAKLPTTGEDPVLVSFRLIELTGSHMEDFVVGMHWDSLKDNLLAVPPARGGRAIHKAIKETEDTKKITILIIEDRGTKGLEGKEQRDTDTDKNSFCALVRDELYSDKSASDTAGGSFGLGKSVLWAYSAFKTVLFASAPASAPAGKNGLRFIGRTSLPYHETNADGRCTGDGWLGARQGSGSSRWAESLWSSRAEKLSKECLCSRTVSDSGLSIAIVGFSEPGEEDRNGASVVESIIAATMESFWPAIVRDTLQVRVCHERDGEVIGSTDVDPINDEAYRLPSELLQSFHNGQLEEKDLLSEGESAVRWVENEIPKRLADPVHPATRGRAAVIVKLIEDTDAHQIVRDRVYTTRQPGMVVRSGVERNLTIAARPYVAVVLAGLAADDSPANAKSEQFLRAAEPPEHDRWTHNTRRIKDEYQVRGCKAMLTNFQKAVSTEIRRLVSVPEAKGGQLPRSILRFLRFGESGGGGSERFVSVTRTRAWTEDDVWKFSAHCKRIRPDSSPWHIRIRLKYAVDGGSGDDVRAITEVSADQARSFTVQKGIAQVVFPPEVVSASIKGTTSTGTLPAVGTRGAVLLRVDGAKGDPTDA